MRKIDERLQRAFNELALKPGDIYESCSYHPVLCLGVDYKNDEIWGVSLVDGTYPRSCSLLHCGVRRLTPKQAWQIKLHGPVEAVARARISQQNRWWNENTEQPPWRVGLSGPRKERPPSSAKSVVRRSAK